MLLKLSALFLVPASIILIYTLESILQLAGDQAGVGTERI